MGIGSLKRRVCPVAPDHAILKVERVKCNFNFAMYAGPTPNGELVGKSVDDSDDVDAIRPAPLEKEEEEEEFQQHQPSSDQEQRQRRKKVGEIQDAFLIRCGTLNCSRQVALEAEHMHFMNRMRFLKVQRRKIC